MRGVIIRPIGREFKDASPDITLVKSENVEPADLSLEACFKVIELQKSKAETRKTKAASRNRGTVNMEEESEKPEESAKSKAASKVKGTAKAKK